MNRSLGRAACAMVLVTTELSSQTIRSGTLGPPTASFREPFSRVADIREQSDGRVVVLDGIEASLKVVNFPSGTATSIGRRGSGPAEYTLPIALVALAGDTTLAVDMSGGGRALVITRSGAASTPLRSARVAANTPLFMRPDIQGDAQGRIYELVSRLRSEAGRLYASDVSGVRRLDRRSGAQDTVGQLSRLVRSPLLHPRSTPSSPDGVPQASRAGGPPPFASVDQWAVAPDGRIAFVTVTPYRVSFLTATGEHVEGAPLRFAPVAVDRRLKDQWRKLRQQPVPSLTYGPNGVSAGRTRPQYVEPDEWPATLPPFLPDALRFAPDGVLWIERATPADQPQTFDLIDRTGAITRRVVLPQHTRLVGFGADAVYTVRIDDDDLEYLQRHRLPN